MTERDMIKKVDRERRSLRVCLAIFTLLLFASITACYYIASFILTHINPK